MSLVGRTTGPRRGSYRYLLLAGKLPLISETRKMELLKLVKAGDSKAKEELILAHIRLAFSVVDRYTAIYNCRYWSEEMDGAAIDAVLCALERVSQGQLAHDNVTGYVICYIHGFVRDSTRQVSVVPLPRGVPFRKSVSLEGDIKCNFDSIFEIRDMIDVAAQTKKEKRVIDLRIKGYSDREVAEIMEIPQVTVYRIRHRVRERFERLNQDV